MVADSSLHLELHQQNSSPKPLPPTSSPFFSFTTFFLRPMAIRCSSYSAIVPRGQKTMGRAVYKSQMQPTKASACLIKPSLTVKVWFIALTTIQHQYIMINFNCNLKSQYSASGFWGPSKRDRLLQRWQGGDGLRGIRWRASICPARITQDFSSEVTMIPSTTKSASCCSLSLVFFLLLLHAGARNYRFQIL